MERFGKFRTRTNFIAYNSPKDTILNCIIYFRATSNCEFTWHSFWGWLLVVFTKESVTMPQRLFSILDSVLPLWLLLCIFHWCLCCKSYFQFNLNSTNFFMKKEYEIFLWIKCRFYVWYFRLQFPLEVQLLKREHFNRWFRIGPYYLAMTAAKLPMQFFLAFGYITMIYTMSDQPLEFTRMAMFYAIALLIALTSESLGVLISSRLSLIVSSIFYVFCLFSCAFQFILLKLTLFFP